MKSLQQTLVEQQDINESKIIDDISNFINNSKFLQSIKDKSTEIVSKCGKAILIEILNICYVVIDKNIPIKDKMAAIACLVYVISPMDVISDFLPMGYTDDIAMISYTLSFLDRYITPDIKKKSEDTYNKWFKK